MAEKKEIRPLALGDVVRLKSGGPKMTVSHCPTSSQAECVWVSKDGVFQKAYFHFSALVRAR